MKLSQRILATLTVVFFGLSGAKAQNTVPLLDLKRFQEASGQYSALYRGHQETRYAILANGHPYWESTEFKSGDIVFEGRLYKDVSLNFDAVMQEVLVMAPTRAFIVALDCKDVAWFSMGDSKFVNSSMTELDLPEGIYEILHQGKESILLNRVTKELSSSPNYVNGNEIGYNDPDYMYNVLSYFAYNSRLYLTKDGKNCVLIKNKGSLKRQFPSRKKEFSKIAESLDNPSLRLYCKVVLNTIDQL